MENYPVRDNLDANVGQTGLLLVDAVGKKALNTLHLTGAAIEAADAPGTLILAGSFRSGGVFSQSRGVVLFDGLAPGRYRLVKVKVENANQWESVLLPDEADYAVDIEAGSVAYVGQIEVRHPMGTTRRDFTINHNPDREKAAWQMVLERYGESAWSQPIAQRLEEP